ncbi:SDR family oxidoreductase [uncultured Sphingosinicella sp.]|uniref:SDR family oxidoreductase n=1 Tax=uncultured Sphingosinicella sp. TaxID=478748 RepID=UPI0030D8D884|tara:strand:+ start:47001 stop:47795 length:795 start_codon:yes stop_codon:yes gene_type:complete
MIKDGFPAGGDRDIVLVTGANKGIGFEVVRQLAETGQVVLLGARNRKLGETATERLHAEGLDVHLLEIDITDGTSIAVAADRVQRQFGRLDVLINNAGILLEGDFDNAGNEEDVVLPLPSSVSIDIVRRTFSTNTFGAIAMINAFLPLLRKAKAARIVNVSSRLASLSLADRVCRGSDETFLALLAYNSSKAALNAATLQYAIELRESGIRINAADPGHCATDINGHLGDRSPADAARAIVHLAGCDSAGPTGIFYGENGAIDW